MGGDYTKIKAWQLADELALLVLVTKLCFLKAGAWEREKKSDV